MTTKLEEQYETVKQLNDASEKLEVSECLYAKLKTNYTLLKEKYDKLTLKYEKLKIRTQPSKLAHVEKMVEEQNKLLYNLESELKLEDQAINTMIDVLFNEMRNRERISKYTLISISAFIVVYAILSFL